MKLKTAEPKTCIPHWPLEKTAVVIASAAKAAGAGADATAVPAAGAGVHEPVQPPDK